MDLPPLVAEKRKMVPLLGKVVLEDHGTLQSFLKSMLLNFGPQGVSLPGPSGLFSL